MDQQNSESSSEESAAESSSSSSDTESQSQVSPGKTRSGRDFRDSSPAAHTSAGGGNRRSVPSTAPRTPSQDRRGREEPLSSVKKEVHANPPGKGSRANASQSKIVPTAAVGLVDRILDYKIFWLIAVVVIFLAVIAYFIDTPNKSTAKFTTPWTPKARFEDFDTQFSEFLQTFPHQLKETMISISSGIRSSVAEEEPVQPSAFVVLIPPTMKPHFPTCFTKRIGSIVNSAFEPHYPVPVKETDLTFFQNSVSITAIHDDLKKYLDSKGKVVVVHDVDKLDQKEHLYVLHAFCDNSEAYDKRASYFFLLPVPTDVYEEFEWKHGNGFAMADKILTKAWHNVLPADSIPALFSRIAGKVILLNEGDQC